MNCLSLALAFTAHIGGAGAAYNEIHPHVRCEYKGAAVGTFLNSAEDWATYATYTLEHEGWFLEVGAVHGYRDKILPYGRAGYSIDEHTAVFAAPIIHGKSPVGVVLGVEFSF